MLRVRQKRKDERKRTGNEKVKTRRKYAKELKMLLRPVPSTICVTNHLSKMSNIIMKYISLKLHIKITF